MSDRDRFLPQAQSASPMSIREKLRTLTGGYGEGDDVPTDVTYRVLPNDQPPSTGPRFPEPGEDYGALFVRLVSWYGVGPIPTLRLYLGPEGSADVYYASAHASAYGFHAAFPRLRPGNYTLVCPGKNDQPWQDGYSGSKQRQVIQPLVTPVTIFPGEVAEVPWMCGETEWDHSGYKNPSAP